MNILLSVLIIAAAPNAPTEAHFSGAVELFRCTFDESADADFDGWPDGWTRQQGPGFPHYVKILISPDPTPAGDRCLRFEMDGGAAAARTPPIEVEPGRDYVVEGLLQTEGLDRDRAYLSLTFLDQRGQAVETFASEKIGRQTGWHRVRLGPVAPKSDLVRRAVIGVHVEPGDRADLQGVANFGDLWLGRLPRVGLSTGNATGLFTEGQPVTITCSVAGMAEADARVRFELLDESGTRLAAADVPLKTPGAMPGAMPTRSLGMSAAQWQPRPLAVGFYRVRATASGHQISPTREGPPPASQGDGAASATAVCREIVLAVLRPEPVPAGGEFGWSISGSGSPLAASLLSELAVQSGVRWIKYPLAENRPSGGSDGPPLAEVLQRLSRQGIEVVGVIEPPADPPGKGRGEAASPSIAEWLGRDRKVWAPALEAIAARSGGQIAWWQLGGDGDRSFVGCGDLAARLDPVEAAIEQAGLVAHLGIGWDRTAPPRQPTPPATTPKRPTAPNRATTPARFTSATTTVPATTAPPPVAPAALRFLALADAVPPGPRQPETDTPSPGDPKAAVARWVTLEAISADRSAPQSRAADLALRMIAAKAQGAAAVFLADPLDADHGLFDADRHPGDLFLPWRTTALLLGGAKPAGRLVLPQGSLSEVFLRDRDAVVAVWNPRLGRETIGWGEGAGRVDLWGRQTPLAAADAPSASSPWPTPDDDQTIEVGPVPVFLVGIDPKVAQWQVGVALAKDHVLGPLDPRQANELTWRNTLDQDVQGTVTLSGPDDWTIEPRRIAFRLAGGESIRRGLDLVAAINALSGRQVLRADFELRTSPARRFSVWLPVRVGPDDVRIQMDVALNARGEMEVRQRVTNNTDGAVGFRCRLFVPDRRSPATLVTIPPHATGVQAYPLSDGPSLLGKALWLQAEEIDGPRVLNCACVVGE